MNNRQIARQRDHIDALFQKVGTLGADSEVQSHWARYLCVLVHGFIENSVREIFLEYTRNRSTPEIVGFVEVSLKKYYNLKAQEIFDLTNCFDSALRTALEPRWDGKITDAFGSVVGNRHLIAHGGSVGLTYARMKDYYESIKTGIDIMESLINP